MPFERHVLFWTASAILFAYLVQLLAPVLLPFVVGLGLAYLLNPFVDAMGRIGLPRWASAILLLSLSTCLIVLAVVFVVPILVEQAADLLAAAPRQLSRLKDLIEVSAKEHFGARFPQAQSAVNAAFESFTTGIPSLLGSIAETLWKQSSAAFNFFSVVLVTPIVCFYALIDWPKIIAKLDSWLPRDNAGELRLLAVEIDERVSAFIRGQGAVCLILALFYAVSLSLAGLDYGLLVGLLTGLAAFIPVFGWTFGAASALILAILQFWPDGGRILIVAGIMLAGQALESAVLSPKIVGSEVGLHPVWLIFALLTFSYLFGFLGLLVAVPVFAAIGVLVRYALQKYLASSVYLGRESEKGSA